MMQKQKNALKDQMNLNLSKARNILEDPSVLDKPLNWFLNGEKGVRHAEYYCRGYKPSGERGKVTATLQETIDTRPCPKCFMKGMHLVVSGDSNIGTLIVHSVTADESERVVDNPAASLDAVHRALANLQPLFQIGEDRDNSRYDSVRKGINEFLEKAQQTARKARALIASRSGELMMPVALGFMGSSRGYAGALITNHELSIFDNGYGAHASKMLFDQWSHWKANGQLIGEEQLEQLHHLAVTNSRLADLNQLKDVPVIPGAGVDSLDAGMIAWALERDRLVEVMLERWERQLKSLLDQTEPVIVGVKQTWYTTDRELIQQTLEAFTIRENPVKETLVLRAPTLIAAWLVAAASESIWRSHQPTIQPVASDASDAEAETALMLWDPEAIREEPHCKFETCMESAKALMK